MQAPSWAVGESPVCQKLGGNTRNQAGTPGAGQAHQELDRHTRNQEGNQKLGRNTGSWTGTPCRAPGERSALLGLPFAIPVLQWGFLLNEISDTEMVILLLLLVDVQVCVGLEIPAFIR